MKSKIPKIAYGIVDPKGVLYVRTMSEWKRECIKWHMHDMGMHINQWKEWTQEGWSIAKFDLSKMTVIETRKNKTKDK